MRVADLVKISVGMMETLSKSGIRMGDFRYVELFSDYEKMVLGGGKISYVVAVLAEKYVISEASVYRILRRFKATI